jgi:hypothetical protein
MYHSPLRTIQAKKDWILVGHNSSVSQENSPSATRAIYSFQPRLRHLDFRKTRRQKASSFDKTFTNDYSSREVELFPKFPTRKTPNRSKRPTSEHVDFLGTQLWLVGNKRNRLFFI